MLISVHVEKTAGTSFSYALQQTYGTQGLLLDYEFQKSIPPWKLFVGAKRIRCDRQGRFLNFKPEIKCIHGHFLPLRYLNRFDDAKFITWVREPAKRLVSHYFNYVAHPGGPEDHLDPVVKAIKQGGTFDDFIEYPTAQNRMAMMLQPIEVADYDFVGITEHFEADLRSLASMLGWSMDRIKPPVANTARVDNYKTTAKELLANPERIERIRKYHGWDYEVYQQAVERREKRVAAELRVRVEVPVEISAEPVIAEPAVVASDAQFIGPVLAAEPTVELVAEIITAPAAEQTVALVTDQVVETLASSVSEPVEESIPALVEESLPVMVVEQVEQPTSILVAEPQPVAEEHAVLSIEVLSIEQTSEPVSEPVVVSDAEPASVPVAEETLMPKSDSAAAA